MFYPHLHLVKFTQVEVRP